MLNQESVLEIFVIILVLLPVTWCITRWYARRALYPRRRAEILLRDILTQRELRQLFWRNYVEIPSKITARRVYRVPRTNSYVQVRENGRTVMWLCLQPTEQLPDDDIVVLHKLMIEAQEEIYLQTANKFHHFTPYTDL